MASTEEDKHKGTCSQALCALRTPTLGSAAQASRSCLLGRVLSRPRFLGDNQAQFLITLPLNPFLSQSSSFPQMLKPQARFPPRFLLPSHSTTGSTNLSYPKNAPQNFLFPFTPLPHSSPNCHQHSSAFFAPRHPESMFMLYHI